MPKRKRGSQGFSEYQYESLSSSFRQIRLLRLQPSRVLRDVVKCEIEAFNIDEAPEYEALSYAWGDAFDLTYIKVGNRRRLQITRSLDFALRYMRHKDKERLVWADAVCINQRKTAEKNETVTQMHLIYRNARQVVVWLGQPIRPWSFRVIMNIPEENFDGKTIPPTIYFRGKCQIENRLNSNARALLQFGKLPWFRRGWVIQEVCFARRIQIQFGRHLLSWEHFEKVAIKLAAVLPDFLHLQHLGDRRAYIAIEQAISSLAQARIRLVEGQATTLSSLLPFARTKHTTDPRDKIFAFLNLLPVLPAGLQVDYAEDVRSLYMKVAQLLLRGDAGLRLLAECEFNENHPSDPVAGCLPSWVPDWARARDSESLPGGISTKYGITEFSAGVNLLPKADFQIHNDRLLLAAVVWDDIIFLDPLVSVDGVTPNTQTKLLAALGIDPKICGHHYFPQVRLSNSTLESYEDFQNFCQRVDMCNRDPDGMNIKDINDFPHHSPNAAQHKTIVGRSLVLTSEHYVGWAPPGASLEDIVAVIPGCHVPIVLRRICGCSGINKESAPALDAERLHGPGLDKSLPLFSVVGEACKLYFLSMIF